MSKSFFDLSGSINPNYREEARCQLQPADTEDIERNLHDARLGHDDNGSYIFIESRASVENRDYVCLTPQQALKLLEFLQWMQKRLQELCEKETQA